MQFSPDNAFLLCMAGRINHITLIRCQHCPDVKEIDNTEIALPFSMREYLI